MDCREYLSNPRIPVEVHFSMISGSQQKRIGIAVVTDAKTLEVNFADDDLPDFEQVDYASECLVFIETEEIVTLICRISKSCVAGRLTLSVLDLIRHGEKREFFRGPAGHISICCSRKIKDMQEVFPVQGINISCGGILMTVSRKLEKRERLVIEFYLPEPIETKFTCQAFVLRVQEIHETEFLTAVRFIKLDSEICDDIMAFCFAEERRRIREYVVPKDF